MYVCILCRYFLQYIEEENKDENNEQLKLDCQAYC